MAMGRMKLGLLGALGAPQASSFGRAPAPAGYHYEFVLFNGTRVYFNGTPVVGLVGN